MSPHNGTWAFCAPELDWGALHMRRTSRTVRSGEDARGRVRVGVHLDDVDAPGGYSVTQAARVPRPRGPAPRALLRAAALELGPLRALLVAGHAAGVDGDVQAGLQALPPVHVVGHPPPLRVHQHLHTTPGHFGCPALTCSVACTGLRS